MRRSFSVAIFARNAGEVLLIHHKRLGVWLPVGGEIEPGETPLEAAQRELMEETGLVGAFSSEQEILGSPPGLLAYEEHPAGSKGLHMNFCFVADVPSREVRSNGEFEAHRWVRDTAGLDAPPNVHQLVAKALATP